MYIKLKKILEQHPSYLWLFVVVILLSTWIYWSEVRPTLVKKECYAEALADTGWDTPDWKDRIYKECLRKNGI